MVYTVAWVTQEGSTRVVPFDERERALSQARKLISENQKNVAVFYKGKPIPGDEILSAAKNIKSS